MLGWFVDLHIVTRVMTSDSLIEETEVEVRPEKVPMKCIDENVCINNIRKYFTFDAWSVVNDVMMWLQSKGTWLCTNCLKDLHSFESIYCDSCINWYHLKCVGLSQAPKSKYWYCRLCHV